LQLWVSLDDATAPSHCIASLLEDFVGGCLQPTYNSFKRWECVRTEFDFTGDDFALHFRERAEKHLALVGEVIEEASLGKACPLGDLCDGCALESLLGEEFQSGRLQTANPIGFPPRHKIRV